MLHLKFDGNYLDSSGRNNDGTPQGSLPGPTFVPGKIGNNAVHVESEADLTDPANPVCTNANYVTLGIPADLQFGADIDFSVAYWVKVPADVVYTEFPVLCDSVDGTFSPACTSEPIGIAVRPARAAGRPGGNRLRARTLRRLPCLRGPI